MPQLYLDKEKCLKNIERMARKAQTHQLSFRPHCKTHQSAEILSWFRNFGISKITVSSFSMASYFAQAGWSDILVAFPFDPGQISILNELTKSVRVSILIDNPGIFTHLASLEQQVKFYIDTDTGYGRTGVKSDAVATVDQIIRQSIPHKNLSFEGFYCHAGNSYQTSDPLKREEIHLNAVSALKQLKEQFRAFDPKVLYGDTPNCSTQEHFEGIDEMTPGNFVFYDLIQHSLGACKPEDIAVAMACPVVGSYPSDRRLVIHGGAVHFSKEVLQIKERAVFGQVVKRKGKGWEAFDQEQYIHGVSQEHGVLENCGDWMEHIQLGDTLYFLPVHSCLTANLMREYITTDGQILTTLNS